MPPCISSCFNLIAASAVLLIGRDDVGERRVLPAGVDGAPAHVVEIPDDLTAVGGRGTQQAAHGAQVVVDDVTKRPASAGPRMRSADARAQIGCRLCDRRGDLHARRLGQETNDVVAERRGVLVSRPVVVEQAVRDDTGMAIALEFEGHRRAEQRGFAPQDRVDVRIDRIGDRRRDESGSVGLQLMHREKHLRMPLAVEEPRQVAALRHVHHEGIAVDVVAGIFVIGPRHRRALERRVFVLVVPVDDEPVAVRVEHRDDDDHGPAKLVERRVVVRDREGMKQFDRRLGGAYFCRVDAAADDDDDLVGRCEPAGVGFVRACADRPDAGCRGGSARGCGCSRATTRSPRACDARRLWVRGQ